MHMSKNERDDISPLARFTSVCARQTFSSVEEPPRDRGTRWSNDRLSP